ncbi:MAG: single-stranded DNA-binding protein [Planctomycetaceae bacterium]
MSASYNRVILVGNLTRDPEVRYTPGGTAVSEIGMAVNRTWFDKNSNERKEETTFVDVTLWGRQAEVAGEYLSKGRSVLIEGRLQTDSWDDKETGKRRSKLKVVAEEMRMLGGPRDGGGGGGGGGGSRGSSQSRPQQQSAPSFDEPSGGGDFGDDVPF